MGYITNFIVYTLAMVGVIVLALVVFKNATATGGKSSKLLKVVDTLSLGQRKTLYIVSTGQEQFLIAGDVNNTTLISKLDNSCSRITNPEIGSSSMPSLDSDNDTNLSFQETMIRMPRSKYTDNSNIGIHSSIVSKKSGSSVMKNLADILRK